MAGTMRRCRFWQCGKPFQPKPGREHFRYCTWEHYVADGGKGYERDRRGYRRAHEQQYDKGFWDGNRARPAAFPLSLKHWRWIVSQLHPDRFAQQPDVLELATEVLKWLTANRPREDGR
jgi:hypothetical protein